MRSRARGFLFHVRPLALGLTVAVAQGAGEPSGLSFRFIRTADIHASADVLARIDALARATSLQRSGITPPDPEDDFLMVFKALTPAIDREQARLLLTHES